jgi:hypothetical protein
MPSRALRDWRTTQQAELDRLDGQLRLVGGSTPDERAVRRVLVDSIVVQLAGHFQRYCRDLYGEAVDFLVKQVQPKFASDILNVRLMEGIQLARGNAHPGSLTTDFRRLGLDVWKELAQHDPRNTRRRERLEQLSVWRNAVAHQDPGAASRRTALLKGTGRNVHTIRIWRHNCSALAHDLDIVVKHRLAALAGRLPWR